MGLLEFRSFGLSGEDEDICIDLISGFYLPPNVRGRDWIVPRLDGRIAGNRRKDVLVLPLAGIVKGRSLEDWLSNTTALMDVMDPSLDAGTLELSDGYLGLAAGVVASIQARCRNAAPGRIEGYRSVPSQRWTFELEVLTPEWTFGS